MRILVVSDVSSWMPGGVPAETRGLLKGLLERGHDVALASDAPMAGAEGAIHLPITVPTGPRLAEELAAAIERFRPEIVHIMCMSSKGVLQLAPVLRRQAWTLTMHSVPPYEKRLHGWHRHDTVHYAVRSLRYLPHSLAWRWIFRTGIVPRVIVHSAFVESVVARYGFPRDRIDHIPLFFRSDLSASRDPTRVRDPSAPALLTVAGLTHTKGQRDVVAALPALLQRFPGLRYRMIGEVRDASYVASLKLQAKVLRVEDRIMMSSDVPSAELSKARAEADIYVQPSHEEGFCLAFAEAAASVPRLVGTDTGAIAAMSRDDVGAIVVPVRDPAAIARAVSAHVSTALPAAHMEARRQRLSERFGFDRYLEAHEHAYAARQRA